jgi:hypothetical protein
MRHSSFPVWLFRRACPLYATIFTEVAGSWTRYQSITFTAG